MAVLRHDDPDSAQMQKGSVHPDITVRGPDPLPFSCDPPDLAGAR